MTITFILGGARSGKSTHALRLGEASAGARIFIATAEALDTEMADRIERHRAERQDRWETIEEPINISAAISKYAISGNTVLIDCLTLWLSNLFHHERDAETETSSLANSIERANGNIILVSNEIGLGLVPETSLGRNFRDAQGRLNQKIAAVSDVVEFVAAGIPLKLKG